MAPLSPQSSSPGVIRSRLWLHPAAGAAATLCICCGSATPNANTPSGPLPAYSGHAAELFDDEIDPGAVGFATDQAAASSDDAALRERTQTGDAVVRARVVTVTSTSKNDHPAWQVGLRPIETLTGKRPPEGDFTFVVGSRGASAGIVRSLEGRLVGTSFVVFLREFAGAADASGVAGPPQTHFHMGKDDKAELDAVRGASVLGEVR